MKILGREIDYKKISLIFWNNPQASFIGLLQKIRQELVLDNYFKSGYSLPPTTITIEATYNCNLSCKTCWFYGNKGIFKDKKNIQSLDFNELKKIIKDSAKYKPYIYITGGEPLINKCTIPFVKYAKSKSFIVGIVTNGTLLTKENVKNLIDAKLDFITVSIDGNKEVHNKIRGQKCFDYSIEGIKNLVKGKKEYKKKLPIVTLNCTISDYNYKHLEEVVEIGEELGVDIVALQHPCFLKRESIKKHHFIFSKLFGKSDKLIDGYENEAANRIDINELHKILERIKKKNKKVSLRLYQDFPFLNLSDYYEKEKAINGNCINPWYAATIKPNGDVTPCLGYVVGNIKEESFNNIWNNQKFKDFRKVLKQKKYFPACIRCCGFFFNWKNKDYPKD